MKNSVDNKNTRFDNHLYKIKHLAENLFAIMASRINGTFDIGENSNLKKPVLEHKNKIIT